MPTGDDSSADPNIGRVVADRYRIVDVIAKGGMGKVYRGEHVHMRNQVAVKLLNADSENLPELVARFERESIVGAHARHENVGMATDFGKDKDGSYYLVMEYIDGVTLRSEIDKGPFSQRRAVDVALQIAHGLDAIHALDIVHRDLNPRNVLIEEDDLVKLIDFGFARVPLENFEGSDETMSITTMGEVFGTIGFIAPEAAFGMVAVDKPADLYALGVILYEMLTGKHPFEAPDKKRLFRAHTEEEPPPPSTRTPQSRIPPELEKIIMRLLEKSPNDRYDTAIEVIDAIEAAVGETHPEAPPVVRAPARVEPPEPPPATPHSEEEPHVPLNRSWGGWVVLGLLVAVTAAFAASQPLRESALALLGPSPSGEASATPSAAPPAASSAPAARPTSSSKSAAAPRPQEVDGVDADGWRKTLKGAVSSNDIGRGVKALSAIATIDPDRFLEADVRRDAAAAATMTALGDQSRADELFELLGSGKLGAGGPDVLFRMVTHHGGSRGAKRAAALLARPEVLKLASPAMKIAHEMREKACGSRAELFPRAIAEGDERVLAVMTSMDAATCVHTCCMRYNSDLDEAVRKLRRRLR